MSAKSGEERAEVTADTPVEEETSGGQDLVAYEHSEHGTDLDDRVRGAPAVVFNAEQQEIIRGLIAPDATDSELQVVVAYAQRVGLDPIAKQIYAIPRKSRRKITGADGREQWVNERRLTIQTSIDGLRLVAQRTGDYAGRRGPQWCGEDGKWQDVWLKNEPPAAARVGVLRHGFVEPLYAVAHWKEYVPAGGNDQMWQKMPAGQLAKCAEALALRGAFPAELSGLYTDDEMAQANRRETDPTGGTSVRGDVHHVSEQVEGSFGYPEDLKQAITLFESVGVPFLTDWMSEAIEKKFGAKPESWNKTPDDQKQWVWAAVKKAVDWLNEHESELDTPIGVIVSLGQAREMLGHAFGGLTLEGPVEKMTERIQEMQDWIFQRQVDMGLRMEDGTFTEKGQAEYGVNAEGQQVTDPGNESEEQIEDGEIVSETDEPEAAAVPADGDLVDKDGNPINF
jgi:phage recombination protein Bet